MTMIPVIPVGTAIWLFLAALIAFAFSISWVAIPATLGQHDAPVRESIPLRERFKAARRRVRARWQRWADRADRLADTDEAPPHERVQPRGRHRLSDHNGQGDWS